MKYLILSLLTCSILYSSAQKKLSFELTMNAGIDISRTPPIKSRPTAYFIYDPNTGTTTIVPGSPGRNTNTFKNIISPQGSVGARATYALNDHFRVFGGLAFSFLKVRRENTVPLSSATGGFFNDYVSKEEFDFYNLDIPIGVRYAVKKWSFDAGLTPSVILSSKLSNIRTPSDPEVSPAPWPLNPGDPQPTPDNIKKTFISAFIAPAYQAGKKIKIGIEYSHGLTNMYEANFYSSGIYQQMKNSTLSLKIIYKLN